jgi:acetolactate synthase-1/3 small subunit
MLTLDTKQESELPPNGNASVETGSSRVVLELTVNNHPGVMSHVCGLFSRRAFNVDGILCLPLGDGQRSRIWLLVPEDDRLPQVISQLKKLEDVLEVHPCPDGREVFEGMMRSMLNEPI